MTKFLQFVFALSLCFIASFCAAAEYERLIADIDGDKTPEVIVLSTSGAGDFQDFTIRIGEAAYSDKFFAVDGVLPELRIISIDWNRPSRQLVVKTSEAASCNFHILSYTNHKLYLLLKFISDSDCVSPQPHGNGTIDVQFWEGFWWRIETYRLDPTGSKLTLVPKDIYSVDVTAVSKKDFILTKDRCRDTKVSAGGFLRVDKYDSRKHLYFLRASNSVCGWMSKDTLNGNLDELPWAK
jgi:hypothetical protein